MNRPALPLAWLALAVSAHAQHWFDGPLQPIHTGAFYAHGDVDGDGYQDLIGGFGAGASLYRNDGVGGFTEVVPLLLGPNENVANSQLVDVDGDGLSDLVVRLDYGSPTPGVVIRRSLGDGTFAAPLTVITPGSVHGIARGQVDGDAGFELALHAYGGSAGSSALLWLDWSGGGPVLGPATTVTLDLEHQAPATLDLNGDGLEDLLLANGSTLAVFLTGPGLTLAPAEPVALPFASNDSYELLAADLDADGDEDVVVVNHDDNELLVLEQTAGGALVAGAVMLLNLPKRSHFGDWDGDGDLDLVSHESGVMYQIPNANGLEFEFTSTSSWTVGGLGMGLADFDGDGFLDLLTTHHVVFGDGTFSGAFGKELQILTGDGFDTPVLGAYDVEPDGDLDLVAGKFVYRNDGSGNFLFEETWPAPAADHQWGGATAFADFTGDGREDHLVRSNSTLSGLVFETMRLLAADGLGGYVDVGPAAPGGVDFGGTKGGRLRLAADVDADGDLDVVLQGVAWLNDGSGFFGTSAPIATGFATLPADLDGDGDDDLITIVSGSPPVLRVLHQTAPLTFTATDLALPVQPLSTDIELHVLDLDGDGHLDAVATDVLSSGSALHLYRGDGVGLLPAVSLPAMKYFQPQVAAADVDGDGVLDLLAGGGYVLVYPGLGAPLAYGAPSAFRLDSASKYGVQRFGDFDGDGDVDAVGLTSIAGHRFHGPGSGEIVQYGEGTPGSLGAVPVLGASGPVRPDGETALHLVLANGGAPTFLVLSSGAASLPGFPFGGLTALVNPFGLITILAIPAGGAGPGAGAWTLPVPDAIVASLAGQTLYHQVFAVDPGVAPGMAQTNGLKVVYGH